MTSAVIVGCGNIAAPYATDVKASGVVDIVGFHDVAHERAQAFSRKYGGKAFRTLDEAIAAADLVINLTIFEAHYPVSKAAINRGRHVYSEKPLALSLREARELVALADRRSVLLGAAPFTFLGEAQATAIDWVRTGRLGRVRVAYAEVNHGRIETWHPNPAPFYAVGPMLDVGVYPLALLTAAFGEVRSVRAMSSVVHPERTDLDGNRFELGSPDYWLVELVHRNGERVRLTVNFYVKGDEGVTFHGDEGSLFLGSWFLPHTSVTFVPYEGEPERILEAQTEDSVDWSLGVVSFTEAIETGGESPINARSALHLVGILDAIDRSATTGETALL